MKPKPPPKMPTITTILFILILHFPPTLSSTPKGLTTFISQSYTRDPTATNDTLHHLPPTLKSTLPHSLSSPFSQISSLLSLTLPLTLTIKLVGPTFTSSSPSLLSSYLSHSLSSDHFHVISPFDLTSLSLSLSHSLLSLDPTLSPPSLAHSLSSTLSTHLASSPTPLHASSLSPVPYSLLDSLISQDYHSSKHTSLVIYILNLGPQPRPYAYSYSPDPSPSPSPAHAKCLGTIWTGKERYIWIDLGAGPVDYGPGLSGEGVLPRGEFHPLATIHSRRAKSEKVLLSDIASLVHSAYLSLIVPPLRIPVPFESTLTIQFVHIRSGGGSGSGKGEGHDGYGLDWEVIKTMLGEKERENGLVFKDQVLSFKKYEIDFEKCPLCSYAVSKASSSYTSRFLFDNYTLIVSDYVDSKKLHQVLVDSAEEFKRLGGVQEEDDFGRVIPVYVFDLDRASMLLLDRYHQAVAFKDMVVAVRTKNSQTVSEYTCNGRHVFVQTRELERPIVGAVLQAMWGVSPTHLVWSPKHNGSMVDYTWSVGQTPFGPFSEVASLSFVQTDAARRNMLLSTLNYSISSAIDVLESVKAHGGYQKMLKGQQLVEFSQRWFLFKYKLDKMISALSHWDYELALYYLRSSDHDLYGMHSVVYHASQEIEASLACFKDPPFPWGSFSMSVGTFLLVCFAFAKRDKFFRNKSKQF